MRKLIGAVSFVLVLLSASSSRAEGLAAGVKIGTLGPGVEVTGYIAETLNLRVGYNYLSWSYDRKINDINYDADLDLNTLLTTLDWHPFHNNFRISGGVAVDNNELKLSGTPTESTKIGDVTYTPEQIGTIKGTATFNKLAPYVGIGYGNAVKDDTTWGFIFDLGVLFHGTPSISLSSNGSLANDPDYQNNLKIEQGKIQDDANEFRIYPVLAFGISYYFW